MKKYIIFLFTLIISAYSFAQTKPTTTLAVSSTQTTGGGSATLPAAGVTITNPIPASPDAASLGKFGQTPVGYFTGIPQISIPLYTIKSGDLTLPISLSYHGGGNKVEEIASSVGLGWTLNAGGVITRSVRGLVDESINGYLDPHQYVKNVYKALNNQASNLTFDDAGKTLNLFFDVGNTTYDGEADVFNFNFGSYTGRFSFTESGGIIISPQQNIRFIAQYSIGSPIISFIAITPDGVQWYFGGIGATENTQRNDQLNKSYATGWFLTRVVSPLGYEINFTYKAESYTQFQPGGTKYNLVSGTASNIPPDNDNGSSNGMHTVKLTGITFENGNIQVASNLNRLDINPFNTPSAGSMIDTIAINSTGYSKLYKFFYTNNTNTRLRLDSLVGQPSQIAGNNNYSREKYSFVYNPDPWSPTSANTSFIYAQDWWGYYNGAVNSTLVPALQGFPGAVRDPNPSAVVGGILTQINYPTGGYTKFTFEPNTAPTGQSTSGLRIAQIADYDGINNTAFNTRIYKYLFDNGLSSGFVNFQPRYSYNLIENRGNSGQVTYLVRTAVSGYPLATQQGVVEGYNQVEEYFDNNGEKGINTYYYSIAGAEGVANQFPFAPPVTKEWRIGLLTKQVTSKYIGGNYVPVQEKSMVYSIAKSASNINIKVGFNPMPSVFVPTYNYYSGSNLQDPAQNGTIIYQPYQNVSEFNYISSDTTKVYDSLNPSQYLQSYTNYRYDTTTYQLTQTQTINSKGELMIKTVSYPYNYKTVIPASNGSLAGVQRLYNLGMVSYPIEEVIQKSNADGSNLRTVKAVLTTYKSNKPFRDSVYVMRSDTGVVNFLNSSPGVSTIIKDSHYQPVVTFNKYDNYGNIIQESKVGDAPHTYIWGYLNPNKPFNNNTYPIAEVINADSANVAYTNFESYNSASSSYGNWIYNNSATVTDATAPMGASCYAVSASNTLTKGGLNSANTYIVSLWSKTGTTVVITGGTVTNVATGIPKSGWTYQEYQITGATTVTIGGTGFIDEVRLYPSTAQMSTYTYTPLVGVASKCDTKNNITYYNYDNVGRLVNILDQNRNIIKHFDYHYQGQ